MRANSEQCDRFSCAATTTAHSQYERFMGDLSRAIFVADPRDLQMLLDAKRSQLSAGGHTNMKDEEVFNFIKRPVYLRHCRRAVRPVAELDAKICELIKVYTDGKSEYFNA